MLFFIKLGGEQRLCRECEIHAGWSGQGNKSQKNEEGYQLREPSIPYGNDFEVKNGGLRLENAYFWNIFPDISIS